MVTNQYKDVRNLDASYNIENAQLDNCFIVGDIILNDYLYSQFIYDYGLGNSTFIRVADIKSYESVTLYDILYNSDINKVFVVIDNTRNISIPESDRTISLKEFSHAGEYEYNGVLYWVLFNDSVTVENFYSDNTLVITSIN